MIWATVCSWSLFCWLYRASPFLAAKNIVNLISLLIIWWCPCVGSCLVLLEEVVCYHQWVLLAKLCSPLPCFILYHKAKFVCYSRYLLTCYFSFQFPMIKRTSFFGVSFRSCLHRTVQLQLLQCYCLGNRFGLLWCWTVYLGEEQSSFCSFSDCTQLLHFRLFHWLWGLLHFF